MGCAGVGRFVGNLLTNCINDELAKSERLESKPSAYNRNKNP